MHTIQYSSSRSEVWRWYWRAWAKPSGLWRHHVAIGVLVAFGFTVATSEPFSFARFVLVAVSVVVICMVVLPLWPQLRFKPSVRTLTIDATGIRTSIGRLSGVRAWGEVSTIVDKNEEIVIVGKNQSAFIIPMRAFQNSASRQEFLRDASVWHQKSAA